MSSFLWSKLKVEDCSRSEQQSSVWDRQQSQRQQVAELRRAFKQTVLFRAIPVLLRTNKSDKVNDQRCLSFVYSFTSIYLHTHFSLLGKFGKVIFCCVKILHYKTHPKFWADFDQTSRFSCKNWCALMVIGLDVAQLLTGLWLHLWIFSFYSAL